MAEPVRARRLTDQEGRRLTDQEGRRLLQIVRRGRHESVRVRRAMIIMASASGTPVPAIARLVAADEGTVRDVIHVFSQKGLAVLDPRWAGGRPRLISDEDIAFIVATATTRPEKLGRPFTRWSLRKLAAYLADNAIRAVDVGRERLRQILHARGISFQRTRTWKESVGPDKDAKLDRIEEVTSKFLDRCFAFDQFGPLSIRPCHGACWAAKKKRPAAGHLPPHPRDPLLPRLYSLADDQLRGVTRLRKGADHTLAALKPIRAARPDGPPIYVVLGQPVGEHDPGHPHLGGQEQGPAVLHSHQRLVGQPDRGPVRTAADLRYGRLRPPQPPRAGPPPAGLPGLAQRQRPPPRRPGRPAPRARPHPQRAPTTLGPPTGQRLREQTRQTYTITALDDVPRDGRVEAGQPLSDLGVPGDVLVVDTANGRDAAGVGEKDHCARRQVGAADRAALGAEPGPLEQEHRDAGEGRRVRPGKGVAVVAEDVGDAGLGHNLVAVDQQDVVIALALRAEAVVDLAE
jgi:transposase